MYLSALHQLQPELTVLACLALEGHNGLLQRGAHILCLSALQQLQPELTVSTCLRLRDRMGCDNEVCKHFLADNG